MKKKYLVVAGQALLILLGLFTATFAIIWTTNKINANVTTAPLDIAWTGDTSINVNDMIPISIDKVENNSMSTTFTVKGVETNPNNVYYDVVLRNISISDNLKVSDLKWNLIKNGVVHSYGSFESIGNYNRIVLSPSIMKLPTNIESADTWKIQIYILDNGEDQTALMDGYFNAEIGVDLYTSNTGTGSRDVMTIESVLVDRSNANAPDLIDGLIPVKYNGTTWVKADSTNYNTDWYDYENKMWANAVTVKGYSTLTETSGNGNAYGKIYGNPILENHELTFDGIDDYVDLGFKGKQFSNTMTMIIRIKMLTANKEVGVMGNWEGAGFGIGVNSGNQFLFNMYNNSNTAYEIITNPSVFEIGKWYTVVGRYDGTELSIWVDGIKVNSKNTSISLKQSPYQLILGANPTSSSIELPSNFSTTDTLFYERALTDTEIINLSNDISNYPKSSNDKLLFSYNNLTISTSHEKYMNVNNNTEILESDILAYYTWIPRYKYKLWNVEFLETYPQEIDVVFENVTDTISNGTTNGTYLSHPAFWWDNNSNGIRETGEELAGIWVGKFETTGDTTTPTILPSTAPIVNQNVSSLFAISKKLGTNTYLTNTGITQADSHMMKNMEWGAVTYLTHSKYGTNGAIGKNDYYNNGTSVKYMTGCGSSADNTGNSTTCNAYNTATGMQASTTRNITGIYDMNGGVWEYMMAVMEDDTNTNTPMSGYSPTYNSGFTGKAYNGTTWTDITGINFPDKKYYELYDFGTTYIDQTAYNRSKLGDATGETRSWYSDYANFVSATGPWFGRGGRADGGTGVGAFAFGHDNGLADTDLGARAVLIKP